MPRPSPDARPRNAPMRALPQQLEVELATAILGISSIPLLETFFDAAAYDENMLPWQTAIHVTFPHSAMAIAATGRLMPARHAEWRGALGAAQADAAH